MALDPYTKLPDLREALADTRFEDEIDCIERTFEKMGIADVHTLDNSPRRLTCCFCGVSTGELIAHLRSYLENPPEPVQEEREVLGLLIEEYLEEEE